MNSSFLVEFVIKCGCGGFMKICFNFEWDENKNKINQKKHHVGFQLASKVFYDDNLIEFKDYEHSQSEDRYIAIGMVKKILFVSYTVRYGDTIRIISARRATKDEEALYYANQNIDRFF